MGGHACIFVKLASLRQQENNDLFVLSGLSVCGNGTQPGRFVQAYQLAAKGDNLSVWSGSSVCFKRRHPVRLLGFAI
jgi:hypothetical protein